jgi:hypothetical protein
MADLSPQTLQELRTQLTAALRQPAPAAAPAAALPTDFCTAYKDLRPILAIAASLLPPPYGPGLTALLTVLDKVCPSN